MMDGNKIGIIVYISDSKAGTAGYAFGVFHQKMSYRVIYGICCPRRLSVLLVHVGALMSA
tara:strand:+ start:1263 stop:1442 length:180 start_codon:yes stop_codon:yes gene_type:complete